jgi:hypothetical protein
MTSYVYTNNMPYTYDPNHRGAHYLIEGKYKNHGEFCESVAKFHRGLAYAVNPATSYSEGSDIEEINASVKSSNATLADIFGNSFEQIVNTYFENVHSTLFIYMVDLDDQMVEYHMNAEEFREFVENWATLAVDSGTHFTKVRFKKTSGKMLSWLEDRLN